MPLNLSASQSLALWHQVTIRMLQQYGPDLSARQIAVLLTVYLEDGPHTVRGLSAHLRVSKPAITRALDRLSAEGLLSRTTDDNDRRSVLIQRTAKGSTFLHDFGEAIRRAGENLT
jgi:DNA-binding MarR family transcriptional regulator